MDLRTLFLAQTFALATLAVMLWLGRSPADASNGLQRWRWGLSSQALAYLLLSWRGIPPLVSGIAGNAAGALSVVLIYAAIRQFGHRRVDVRPLVAVVVVVTLVGGLAGSRYAMATVFNGFVYAFFEWRKAFTLWGLNQPGAARVQRAVACCYAAMGLLLPLRALAMLLGGAELRYLDMPPSLDAPVYVFGFVYIVATNIGFLELCKSRAEAEVRDQAHTDDLTGLPNRRALDEAVANAVARARRERQPFAIAMADVDRFKTFNDNFGHAAGDAILACFAGRLRDSVRTADRAFRYGGEEFCILMPASDPDSARAAAETLRTAVTLPPTGKMPGLTASFGVAVWQPGDEADALFGRADRALYQAKAAGRDRVEVA